MLCRGAETTLILKVHNNSTVYCDAYKIEEKRLFAFKLTTQQQ